MEFVGGSQSENVTEQTKIWYRCTRCKHSALITLSLIDKEANKSKIIFIDRDKCTSYSKEKKFSIGEYIYHSEWDDVGKVLRKDKTSNGIHSIIVSFEKLGERILLEDVQIEPAEEIVENEPTQL
jgi:hypothetical protein